MKRILILLISLLLFSCGTTANISNQQISSEEIKTSELPKKNSIRINLHDCCPEQTEALKIEMALKATEKNYNGITTVNISEENFSKLNEYISICKTIAQSINSEISWTNTLNENDEKYIFNFSTSKEISKNIILMREKSITDIYAVYTLAD